MKKFAVLVLFALFITGLAFAQHDPDGTLSVKAKISPVFDVVVLTETYGSTPLDLNENGATEVPVGTVSINTNSRFWKIKLTATDNGNLKALDTDTYKIPFSVRLVGLTAGTNWLANAEVLAATAFGTWGETGVTTATFTKRTTPGDTDDLTVQIGYQDAATNGANWVAQKTDGTDLVYTATVTITALAG